MEVAGPGFLNLTLTPAFLERQLRALRGDERLGVATAAPVKTVVIDYSAPNVAKEMHVGNLRSTVIGDALARMYRFAGHRVVARNHVGDWGTPFAMLIEHLLDLGRGQRRGTVDRRPRRLLQGGAQQVRRRRRVQGPSRARGSSRCSQATPRPCGCGASSSTSRSRYLDLVYQDLDITLTARRRRRRVVLQRHARTTWSPTSTAAGLIVESGGALCVFPPGFTNRDGEPLPLIVQKSDEGFGYAASDLAAVRDRVDNLHADEMLYVVGVPQAQHLEMVFAVARMAGWLPERVRCEHVAFGNVLGTRSQDVQVAQR